MYAPTLPQLRALNAEINWAAVLRNITLFLFQNPRCWLIMNFEVDQ